MDPSHDLKKHIIKCIEGLDDLETLDLIYQVLREIDKSGTTPPDK